jgi:hypothetical protein
MMRRSTVVLQTTGTFDGKEAAATGSSSATGRLEA